MRDTSKLFNLNQNLDAVLIISSKSRRYYTGFQSTFGYLVLLKDKTAFITDPRYFEMAESLAEQGIELHCTGNGSGAMDIVKQLLEQNKVKTVGYEDTELTVAEYNALSQTLKGYKLVAAGEHINFVRRTKDEDEIENITKAQAITDAAFAQILKFVKAGISERDVAIELEYRINKLGGHGLAFDTIVASGVNTSKPHAHPTDKKIEAGDAVTIDFGAAYNGYCSDMTRTFFVGEPSAEMKKIYNIVLMAQNNAIKNCYCGISGKEMDSFCREFIAANGYGDKFAHSTGHSLGIDIHEEPRASATSQDKLLANQFITVEPGIYVPGFGGVRIEDLLLIKEDGVIDLTTSDKNIIIL